MVVVVAMVMVARRGELKLNKANIILINNAGRAGARWRRIINTASFY